MVEYAAPVWHLGLTKEQHDDLERIQKQALRKVYPDNTYAESWNIGGLTTLQEI